MLALVLVAVMCLSMGTVALAADDGSIKVTNATAGQTYEAYKIFDASPSNPDDVTSKIIYTATARQIAVSGFDTYFDTIIDQNGNYTVSKKSTVSDDDLISWIKTNIESLKQGSVITGTWTNNDTYTFSNLAYGYYYITSGLGSLVTIDTAGKDISVYDKNETTPTGPDKKITDEDNVIDSSLDQTSVSLTDNDTSVGSVETFKVSFSATNWVKSDDDQKAGSGTSGTKVTEWNFTDTPTGLDIAQDSVKVTVNGKDVTSTVTDISVESSTGVLTFTIPWVDDNGDHLYATGNAGSELIPVVVTYNATVTDAAATAVAPNGVEVKYNDTTQLGNKVTTNTYTYKFKLAKVDENNKALTGAEFQLFWGTSIAADATPLTFTVDTNGYYRYDPTGSVTNIAPSGTDATATIIGLDNANYMIREVVVPAGYNKADDTAVSGLSRVDTADTSLTVLTIQNLKGTELPSTGGIGTTIFYVIGAILVIGAGIILVTRKRMSNAK